MSVLQRCLITSSLLLAAVHCMQPMQEYVLDSSIKVTATDFIANPEVLRAAAYDGEGNGDTRYFVRIAFRQLPDSLSRQQMQQKGWKLLSHLRGKGYLAEITASITHNEIKTWGLKSVATVGTSEKLSPQILGQDTYIDNNPFTPQPQSSVLAVAPAGKATQKNDSYVVTFFPGIPSEVLTEKAKSHGLQLAQHTLPNDSSSLLTVSGSVQQIIRLARLSIVSFIDINRQNEEQVPLVYENRTTHNVHQVAAPSLWMEGLSGQGVVVGIGDGGELGSHLDFDDRIVSKTKGRISIFGNHADRVAGTIAGYGRIDPRHRGIAPDASLLVQKTSSIWHHAADYLSEYGMQLTSNSYGVPFDCEDNSEYNYITTSIDKQLYEEPQLLHTFAGGNAGLESCAGWSPGYSTISGNEHSGKNVLLVGEISANKTITETSSQGPTTDGRMKPDVVAVGHSTWSTDDNYGYQISSGSSMAAPTAVGILALLQQEWQQTFSADTPVYGGLLKAVLMNTAQDLGIPGPDFTYGFGSINASRAVDALRHHAFFVDSVGNEQKQTHMFTVPSDTQALPQVKVMAYWMDKQAEPFASKSLVNDIDLVVTGPLPTHTSHYPLIVNGSQGQETVPAHPGIDTVNNVEQVTLDSALPGDYQIVVQGTDIPFGPQRYFIVYDIVYPELQLTHPQGEETFAPGIPQVIHWNAPVDADSFSLEYQHPNNGWITIAKDLSPNTHSVLWTPPKDLPASRIEIAIVSEQARDSAFIFIAPSPQNLTVSSECGGSIVLHWSTVLSATQYEVIMYDGWEQTTLGSVQSNTFSVSPQSLVPKGSPRNRRNEFSKKQSVSR